MLFGNGTHTHTKRGHSRGGTDFSKNAPCFGGLLGSKQTLRSTVFGNAESAIYLYFMFSSKNQYFLCQHKVLPIHYRHYKTFSLKKVIFDPCQYVWTNFFFLCVNCFYSSTYMLNKTEYIDSSTSHFIFPSGKVIWWHFSHCWIHNCCCGSGLFSLGEN